MEWKERKNEKEMREKQRRERKGNERKENKVNARQKGWEWTGSEREKKRGKEGLKVNARKKNGRGEREECKKDRMGMDKK